MIEQIFDQKTSATFNCNNFGALKVNSFSIKLYLFGWRFNAIQIPLDNIASWWSCYE